MKSLLDCPVCSNELRQPVTLSCGYTVCKPCIPAPPADAHRRHKEHPTFVCPVKECNTAAHLFCGEQEVHVDFVINRVIDILSKRDNPSLSKRVRLLQSSSSSDSERTDLLNCQSCHAMFKDPITTHCGHTYCRLCLLKYKIISNPCMQCKSPLPQFNHFLGKAATNYIIQQLTVSEANDNHAAPSLSESASSCRRPVFVTGLVILPHQRVRIPVFVPAHLRMLQRAVFSSGTRLLLATVHRGRPTMAQVGTIVEITAVEQHKSGSLILDMVGHERFETSHNRDEYMKRHMAEDIPVLTAQCTVIRPQQPGDVQEHEDMELLADQIRTFLKQVALFPPPALLLGALWFETMQRIHGPLPVSGAENTLWWAAAVLPVSATERYALLHIISLRDRLNLVISWIKQLDSQWSQGRLRQLLI